MVVLSESYLPNLEENAIELGLRFDIAPKHFADTLMIPMPNLEVFRTFLIGKTRRYNVP